MLNVECRMLNVVVVDDVAVVAVVDAVSPVSGVAVAAVFCSCCC